MGIGFMFLLPVVFWAVIVMLTVAVSRPRRRTTQMDRGNSATQRYLSATQSRPGYTKPRQTIKTSADRPKMKEGLFDMDLGRKPKTNKESSGGFFRNSGYDSYETMGQNKKLITGYDKNFGKSSRSIRNATRMQYSHTYDGHEPWDKCIPKEKDPWDKDFYA